MSAWLSSVGGERPPLSFEEGQGRSPIPSYGAQFVPGSPPPVKDLKPSLHNISDNRGHFWYGTARREESGGSTAGLLLLGLNTNIVDI
ncbi:hypothetical protein N7510_001526 [Penicillium lagena]|uniref:uncharacterized protein n=1 Tax=Penicillium lagena TaxID=94218 RepID=UPI002540F00A|nr:uncharacterized protein N7510_001526 [Penicillium lagena]KAJ5625217.1 hypothetical protein N7510_001526 [Penicillium lagena]